VKKLFFAVFALAMAIVIAPAALAQDTTFNYTFTGSDGTVATGTLVGTPDAAPGTFDIASGTIDVSTVGIYSQLTGTGQLSGAGVNGSDNTLTLSSPYVSFGGISFSGLSFSVGGDFVNIYAGDGSYADGLQEGPLRRTFYRTRYRLQIRWLFRRWRNIGRHRNPGALIPAVARHRPARHGRTAFPEEGHEGLLTTPPYCFVLISAPPPRGEHITVCSPLFLFNSDQCDKKNITSPSAQKMAEMIQKRIVTCDSGQPSASK
jgi:hypothetical protein